MKEKWIRIVYIEPKKAPVEKVIRYTLQSLQAEVGGLIDRVALTEDIDLVFNDEGKMMNLTPNRGIWPDAQGRFQDIIFGPILCCRVNAAKGEYESLSDEEVRFCMERFKDLELWSFRKNAQNNRWKV